tara:strand:- start:48 stop:431 length:384 start_codon:yes stop_codon:yes gene_type:complete
MSCIFVVVGFLMFFHSMITYFLHPPTYHIVFCILLLRSGSGFDFSHPSTKIGSASATNRRYSRSRGQSLFHSASEFSEDFSEFAVEQELTETDEGLSRLQTSASMTRGATGETKEARFHERRRRASS